MRKPHNALSALSHSHIHKHAHAHTCTWSVSSGTGEGVYGCVPCKLYCVWWARGRAEREYAQLCASQIYCCVSNFSRPTYLRGLLVKDSRGKGGGERRERRERGPGRTLAKSEQAQRGRRLRGIDPTSICSLHTAIDHTGERQREPTRTVPSLSGIKSTAYTACIHSHTLSDLVYDLTSLITPPPRKVNMYGWRQGQAWLPCYMLMHFEDVDRTSLVLTLVN